MTITRDAMFHEIAQLIAQHSTQSDATLSEDSRFDALGVDSIDLMEIVFRLEEKHGVEIRVEGLAGRETLGDMVDFAVASVTAKNVH